MIQNSKGLWVQWGRNYKNKKRAKQAAKILKRKFKNPFWKAYYYDIQPIVVSTNDKKYVYSKT